METGTGTTILTVRMDAASRSWFDRQRRKHYPAKLNRIAAHLTLFHTLPQTGDERAALGDAAAQTSHFQMQVSGLRSLGRGVAYVLQSTELTALHHRLAVSFDEHLTQQDRQGFRPHVVVQNKVTAEPARLLLAQLQTGFVPRMVTAQGLDWWEYLGGPWRLLEYFPFPPM